MSKPAAPGGTDWKNSVFPSVAIAGPASLVAVLTVGPRLTGVDQGADLVSRVDTHTSKLPKPPGRLDPKNISNPSRLMEGRRSRDVVLTLGTGAAGPKVRSCWSVLA
jgi:hypothetical protein